MIVVQFGRDNEIRKPAAQFPTVNTVVNSATLKNALGFGSNVEAHVNGAAVNGGFALRSGDVVTLITRANSKG
jgi:hypothetical protein